MCGWWGKAGGPKRARRARLAPALIPPPTRSSVRRGYSAQPGDKELIVVTILVAADGAFRLPKVTSRVELKEALTLVSRGGGAGLVELRRCHTRARAALPPTHSPHPPTRPPLQLGSVRADDLLAVEVLWTPEEEGDFFTQRDLAMDYPLLNTL